MKLNCSWYIVKEICIPALMNCFCTLNYCLIYVSEVDPVDQEWVFVQLSAETQHMTNLLFMDSPQAFPEGLASFVLTGALRLRRPSRVWTVRSRLVPQNQLQSSLRTTRARRPARHCCPSCISHPIEGTQGPSHSRHNASGKRGTPKK